MSPKNSILLKAPDMVSGSIKPVSSKSECNRALIIQALSGNTKPIKNLSESDDTVLLAALLNKKNSDALQELNTGNAGTVMRFLTAFCACTPGTYLLTGSPRMLERPIGELVQTLQALGADIQYENEKGFPPLRINGKKLEGGKTRIPAGTSSQFTSALLLCAPYFKKGIELELTGHIVSASYINMTISIMKEYGISVTKNGNTYVVSPGNYSHSTFAAESDWTAASYFYSIVALSNTANIHLNGYKNQSQQGDSVLVSLFEKLGVRTNFTANGIQLQHSGEPAVSLFEYDFTSCPDLAQTLAICCAGLGIEARLHGLQTLRIKESDRIAALQRELEKCGIKSTTEDNTLILKKNNLRISSEIETYNDHRMAMAFAPLAIKTGSLCIMQPGVVTKSYPGFWNDLEKIGFSFI